MRSPHVTLLAAALLAATACGNAVFGAADAASEASIGDGGGDATGVDASTDAAAADASAIDGGGGLKVFVTTLAYSTATTTVVADTICRAEADGRLPGKFVAWFSDATAAAPSRLVDSQGKSVDGPWFRVDGKRVAINRQVLLSTSLAPFENAISLTPTGKTSGGGVWTATLSDGGTGNLCGVGAISIPTTGAAGQGGASWTDQRFFTAKCGDSLALYCFQVE